MAPTTELTIIDLGSLVWIFMKTDIRENVVRAFIEGCREVGQVGSPSALDALGRVVAFQTRPPADAMY
jgi:hypothetical protein